MSTATLDTKKKNAFMEILNITDENMRTKTIEYLRETRKESTLLAKFSKGNMTGDEFERRVMDRITKYYKENGLL